MKRGRITLVAIIAAVLLLPAENGNGQSRADAPNDFTLELLGRCILYSLSYQRMVAEQFGVEVGGSLLASNEESFGFLSLGGRAYLSTSNAAPCITGGVVFGSSSDDSGVFDGDASGAYYYIGPGFEYRSDGGFVLRGTVDFLIRDGFIVWPGLQMGIAF